MRKADSPFRFLHAFSNNSEPIQLLRWYQQAWGWVPKVTRQPARHPDTAPDCPNSPECPLLPPTHPTRTHPSVTARKSDVKAELQREHETVLSNFQATFKENKIRGRLS